MSFEEGDSENAFSPELTADLRNSNPIEVLSVYLGKGAVRRWGFGAS